MSAIGTTQKLHPMTIPCVVDFSEKRSRMFFNIEKNDLPKLGARNHSKHAKVTESHQRCRTSSCVAMIHRGRFNVFLSLTQIFFRNFPNELAECSFKFLVASPSNARIPHCLGNACRWRRDFRDGSFSRGLTIFALYGWSTTGEERVSRSVDKSSVDRSRRAREETEVDHRTAVLGLHTLQHCEVARKAC